MPGASSTVDPGAVLGRAAGIGMGVCGVFGAIAGLIIGLFVRPATAVVAMAELGIPSTVVGGVLGLLAGVAVLVARRVRSRSY